MVRKIFLDRMHGWNVPMEDRWATEDAEMICFNGALETALSSLLRCPPGTSYSARVSPPP
jgi:hypothetical protein